MISAVLPYYRRWNLFQFAWQRNCKWFTQHRDNIEIVMVLDEPSEVDLVVNHARNHPQLRWKIIVNRQDHEWRCPSKPLNVGIRNSTGAYILVMSPETIMLSDVPGKLLTAVQEYPCYAQGLCHLGKEWHPKYKTFFVDVIEPTGPTFWSEDIWRVHCGSIMARKEHFEAVSGYDESIQGWGGDDINLCRRFDMLGLKWNRVMDAVLYSPHNKISVERQHDGREVIPTVMVPNGPDWGTDFSEIAYQS